MKSIIETRFIHWKKHWPSLLIWLLIPIIATIGITKATDVITDDSNVPVGIVLEEDSDAATGLVDEIKTTPFIRVVELDEDAALYQLKKHELDSVFVIRDGYEKEIRNDNRNRLLTSYRSDLSFAYTPVKEMIISYVQQETGRSKAAHVVQELVRHYQPNKQWTWDEIVAKAKYIQTDEDLLNTTFSFAGTKAASQDDVSLFSIWGLWAIFSMLSTLLLFDWVIHEKHSSVRPRFAFMRFSFKHYLVYHFLLYTGLLVIMDFFSVTLFHVMFHENISLWSLICFRLILNLAAFLLANQFKYSFLYYTVSFAITLFAAIGSGAILPNGIAAKWPWTETFNPIQPFLTGEMVNLSSIIIIILAIIWYAQKEKNHA